MIAVCHEGSPRDPNHGFRVRALLENISSSFSLLCVPGPFFECLCCVGITFFTSSIAPDEKGSWKCTCQRPMHSQRCDPFAGHLEPQRPGRNKGVSEDDRLFCSSRKRCLQNGITFIGECTDKAKARRDARHD